MQTWWESKWEFAPVPPAERASKMTKGVSPLVGTDALSIIWRGRCDVIGLGDCIKCVGQTELDQFCKGIRQQRKLAQSFSFVGGRIQR
jgi:hypothetical protein